MLSFLRIKDIDKYGLDDPRRSLHHKDIIEGKPFLRRLYVEWYSRLSKQTLDLPSGQLIELGSGGGFMKEIIPDVKTSDIMEFESNDYTFNALDMPFEDASISAFLMVDVFHHVPDSKKFLEEMERCLKPGGKIIMSEPCVSWWSKIIFKNFHHEPFRPDGDWTIPGTGPMSDANGALPWIVFERDVQLFQSSFPSLKIIEMEKHSALRYLLSGGVSMKQLVPNWSYSFLGRLERFIKAILPGFALFQFITFKKD